MKKKCDFNIRALTANDIFPLADIISKCGLSELKKCFEDIHNDNDYRTVGISIALEIISIICANIGKCRNELICFLSDLSGISQDDIGNMPPDQFALIIKSIIKKEEFRDFFTVLSKLFLWEE